MNALGFSVGLSWVLELCFGGCVVEFVLVCIKD